MRVGTILLTANDQYVKDDGSLPKRPLFDKALLSGLCKGQIVSDEGYDMLPPSIQKTLVVGDNPTMPITIPEINQSEVLIVIRSNDEFEGGKVFKFDNFKSIIKYRKVELWIKIQ